VRPEGAPPGGPPRSDVVYRGRHLEAIVDHWPEYDYEYVRRIGLGDVAAVGVLARTPSDDVLLVRQFRAPIRRSTVEIPAGLSDVSEEDVEACARRELVEETGHAAARIEPIGSPFYASSGLTDERYQLFAALAEEEPSSVPEAGIEVVRMPFAAALEAVRDGRIDDAKTALALLLEAGARPSA
jgi:ADP-ribose pyrophosphatase